ncbi:MAG: hypothetical protein R3C68_07390 [Myxococcota bacterium]
MKRVLLTVLVLCVNSACSQFGGVGSPCPELEVPPKAVVDDLNSSQGNDVVEFDTRFPCEDVVCVATVGTDGYCSHECLQDKHCPSGFVCSVVTSLGPFSQRRFCVWSDCETDDDCGDPWRVRCAVVPELSLSEDIKRCSLR